MPRSQNQKLKLLKLARFFELETDEEHPAGINDLIDYLDSVGISAERKSLYRDIETLRDAGYDIVSVKRRNTGYYLSSAGRVFQTSEVQMLVNAVQASRFMTASQTKTMIRKLEELVNVHERKKLEKLVVVPTRIKAVQEGDRINNNIAKVGDAIREDRQIRFHYMKYTITGLEQARRNGDLYVVSPYAMIWENENYYMMAYDAEDRMMKNYRMDKMMRVYIGTERRLGADKFAEVNLADYSTEVFSMYSGKKQMLRIRFSNTLTGPVFDRFGRKTPVAQDGDQHFIINVTVSTSPQFYAWLFGLGDVQILSPESAREEMRAMCLKAASYYP